MGKFAVIDGQDIINIIEAETLEVAQTATGKTCIQFTNEPAGTGGTYVDGKFIPKKPDNWNESWTLDEFDVWQPPR